MLVRRVARPIAAGRVDLHQQQAVRGKFGLEDFVDLARGISAAPNLHLDICRRDQARRKSLLAPAVAERQVAIGQGGDAKARLRRKVNGPGHAVEHVGAAADFVPGTAAGGHAADLAAAVPRQRERLSSG